MQIILTALIMGITNHEKYGTTLKLSDAETDDGEMLLRLPVDFQLKAVKHDVVHIEGEVNTRISNAYANYITLNKGTISKKGA